MRPWLQHLNEIEAPSAGPGVRRYGMTRSNGCSPLSERDPRGGRQQVGRPEGRLHQDAGTAPPESGRLGKGALPSR